MAPLRLPTNTEASYLSSFLSHFPSPPPASPQSLLNELDNILRLFRLPWVADFLLEPEMNSLSALTAPVNMRNAVASKSQLVNVQTPKALDSSPFDLNFSGTTIFVPSFNVGDISVGFGVKECIADCFSDHCLSGEDAGVWRKEHFRYIRDDKNGALHMIHYNEAKGILKIESLAHITASSRRRVFAICDVEKFRAALHSEQGGLNVEGILNSLHMINFLTEFRACSYCSHTPGPCSCTVEMEKPRHPLDFATAKKNMGTFLGAYEGLANTCILRNGVAQISALVGSRIQVDVDLDQELMTRLCNWAISDQLSRRKENPLALVMPQRNQQQAADLFGLGSPATGNKSDAITSFDWEAPGFDTDLEAALNTSSSSSRSAPVSEMGTGVLLVDKLDQDKPNDNATAWDDITDEAMLLVNSIATSNPDDMLDVDTGSSESYPCNLNQPEPVALAPVVGRPRTIMPKTVVDTSRRDKQTEKELRAERRKQRNREAAQRSNAKRKLRNDTLKQALKDVHAKAAELRARELVLREENLKLRRQTSS